MKSVTRNFTGKEKAIVAVLLVILLFLAYNHFVDEPINKSIKEEIEEQESLRKEIDKVNSKIIELQQMKTEIDALSAGDNPPLMRPYNASKEERYFLASILKHAKTWSIAIGDCTRSGDQIRRQFSASFTTENYRKMEWFLTQLTRCPYRCVINGAKISIQNSRTAEGVEEPEVAVQLTATFFETMVGGTPDAALPADSRR